MRNEGLALGAPLAGCSDDVIRPRIVCVGPRCRKSSARTFELVETRPAAARALVSGPLHASKAWPVKVPRRW
jgi:hypothetical protein